mmetsp:Transcript_43180/g.123477  ORF Transcript_43180/g.123477 Transcript_43180/m.123477 type:complete len:238 (+) Transcript_43180:489-1202(+)
MPEGQPVVVPHLLLVQGQGAEIAGDRLLEMPLSLGVLALVHQDLPRMVQGHRVSLLGVQAVRALVGHQGLVEPLALQVDVGEVELCSRRPQLLQSVNQRDLLDGPPVANPLVAQRPPEYQNTKQEGPSRRLHPQPPPCLEIRDADDDHQHAHGRHVKQPFRNEGADGEENVGHRQEAQNEETYANGRPLGQHAGGPRGVPPQSKHHQADRLEEREIPGDRTQQANVLQRAHQRYRIH